MKVLLKKMSVGPVNNTWDPLEKHFVFETHFSQKKKKRNAKRRRWAIDTIQTRIKLFSLTSSLIIKGEKIPVVYICVCVCVCVCS